MLHSTSFLLAPKTGLEDDIDIWTCFGWWSICSHGVSETLCVIDGSYSVKFRFLADMPPGPVFIMFGILLRLTEGVGWAMTLTTSLAFLPVLFPSHIATLTVSLQNTH